MDGKKKKRKREGKERKEKDKIEKNEEVSWYLFHSWFHGFNCSHFA